MKKLLLVQPNFKIGIGSLQGYWLPYSVGCLWSYAKQFNFVTENFELVDIIFRRERIETLVARLDHLDVCFLSCYMWNWEYNKALAQSIKAKFPHCKIVMGGPQITDSPNDSFFRNYNYIDTICLTEGEETFVKILETVLDERPLLRTYQSARLNNLDIPSPYLSGVFDDILANNPDYVFNATLETNRGCPFACTFCDWGSLTYAKIRKFNLEKVFAELAWMAKNKMDYVTIADANFGVFYERDMLITDRLIELQIEYGYPKVVDATWYKNSSEKILKIVTDAKQVNKVFWKLIGLKLTKIVYEYDVFYFVRFLLFLVKKGVIASRFLVKWGLIIGGVFYSWYKIAEILGIKPKEEGLGKGLNENDIIESDIVNLIRNMANTNYVWSKKTSKNNLPEVAAIQYVLYTGGYFSPIKSPTYQISDGFLVFKSARDVKNVKVYSSTGSLIEEVNNDGFNQFQFNKRLKNGVYIIKTTDTKNKTFTNKITYAGKSYELYTIGSTEVNTPNKINWGYYDDFTENAVKNYQEKNSLEVDGVVGSDTLESMVKNIENNKIDGFINTHKIAKYNFSSNQTDQKVLDKKEIADAYLQQRKQTLDSLNNVFRSEVDREKQDSLSKVWEEWDFSTSETSNN